MDEQKQKMSVEQFNKQRAAYKRSLREDVELLELECKFMKYSVEKQMLTEKFNQVFGAKEEEQKEQEIITPKQEIIMP